MPLFFLLSGFSCTLGYGRKMYMRATGCCGPCKTTGRQCENAEEEIFDSWRFYFNRMTRLLPVYYATYLFALVLSPLGSILLELKLSSFFRGNFLSRCLLVHIIFLVFQSIYLQST